MKEILIVIPENIEYLINEYHEYTHIEYISEIPQSNSYFKN